MQQNSDVYVKVRRQPGDYRIAIYKRSDISDLRWDNRSGGVGATPFGQYYLYGYVQCNGAVSGDVAHSGELGIKNHGPCPHRIKVCIVKEDNEEIYKSLIIDLPPKPKIKRARPITGNSCKKDILIILEQDGTMRRTQLVERLLSIGHGENNMVNTIRELIKEGILTKWKDPTNKKYFMYCLCSEANKDCHAT